MKKHFWLILAAFMALLAPALAHADEETAAEVCPDADGDGYYTAIGHGGCVAPHGKKPGDCDDEHASIHPNAQEVWDDGIDNDCKVEAWDSQDGDNKGDRVSLGAVQVARFAKGLGRSITPASPSELRLLKDIHACKEAGDGCKVDYTGGKLKPAEGYRAVDVDCDGVLNFVEDDYSPTLKDQDKCRKVAARAAAVAARHKASAAKLPAAVTLPGQATSTTAPATAPKAPAKKGTRGAAVDYSAPIATAQATADEAKKLAGETAAKVGAQGEKLSVLDQAIAEQKSALASETARAKAEEGRIDEKAQTALDLAGDAKEQADEAKEAAALAKKLAETAEKKGVVVELALGGTTMLNHDVHAKLGKDSGKYKAGDVLKFRGNSASGAFVGLNVGYANEDTRFTGFFNLLPIADEGPEGWESSIAYQGGVEATFKALHGFGGHALFQQHDAGGSVVGANAYSRGGGVGLSYVGSTSGSNFKVGFQGRATIGLEAYGAGKGSDIAPFAGISLGINFGFGPK